MSETSRANLYGAGVFTTIRIINGEPWLWEKHWRRLMNDADRLGIDTSRYSEYIVRRGLDESIPDQDKLTPQKARITITDERRSVLWSGGDPSVPTNITFLISPLRKVPRPFRVGVSPHLVNSTSPIAGVKTCNYLEPLMELDEARSRALNEAVRINEHGHVTSTCMANLFWLRDGQLYTPSLATGCLPGTTRQFVLEKLEVTEVETGIDALNLADAIFLTSAGLCAVQIDEFDGLAMPKVEHSILNLVPM
jgi:branched-subunit amino acid aminotransferase/4-amino-4-deoxychorismate lyase